MIDSKKTEAPATVPTPFRRAAPPPQRAPIPAGQTNTAALGANGTLRLNKRMAELGLASRREADDWIAKGWVKVNGRVAEMGMQVAPDVKIEIDKLAKGQQANLVTVLINKPRFGEWPSRRRTRARYHLGAAAQPLG